MRRGGPPGWLSQDLRHRGVTAWALSSLLLAFYLGLYLSAESKQVAWRLGIAAPRSPPASYGQLPADAPMRLTAPGLAPLTLAVLAGALVALGAAWFARREGDAGREAALRMGGRTAGLTLATLYGAVLFADVLEPVAVAGRHLLPAPGQGWPLAWVALPLACAGAVFLWGVARVIRARSDRAAALRASALPLAALYAALLVALYGTHMLDPGATTPPGERSLRAFGQLLYARCDSKWTLYGLLYTMAVTVGGVWMLGRYAHNRYQVVRTLVVMAVQVSFGFSVPVLLSLFQRPAYYLSYFWPLKIEAFYPDNILREPAPFVLWSFLGSLVLVPALGVFFGKRWYCSWVCGCGGLANTAGEPWRHLSQKGDASWRIERVTIHLTLALALVTTALVVIASWVAPESRVSGVWWSGHGAPGSYAVDGALRSAGIVEAAARARYYYGVAVSAVLSGAIGVGLYPLGGTRLWCRYFCPMAALLGIVQKAGRFRVEVKPDMCISCGMCTEYCEMGIDVRSYAQANESFTRASCVGCGMCAEVCPRGVLSLTQRGAPGLVRLRLRRDG